MEFKKYKCKIKDEIYFLLDQIKSKKTKKDNNNNNNKDTDNKINKIKKYIAKIKRKSKNENIIISQNEIHKFEKEE